MLSSLSFFLSFKLVYVFSVSYIGILSASIAKEVPHGSLELGCPRGVGLENERGPDSLALGWQLNPKQQGTDVPLIPSPFPLIPLITIKLLCPFDH